jgi:hypothetical protein
MTQQTTRLIHCSYEKLLPISEIKPNPENPNTHSQDQIERLAKILRYQGWRSPVQISSLSGFVVVGHGRLAAAAWLHTQYPNEYWDQIPVDVQFFASSDVEYAHMVADNAIADWAELNLANINIKLGDLGPDFDVDLFGIENFKLDYETSDLPEKIESANQFIVSVHCKDEADMSLVYDEMMRRGYECNLIR